MVTYNNIWWVMCKQVTYLLRWIGGWELIFELIYWKNFLFFCFLSFLFYSILSWFLTWYSVTFIHYVSHKRLEFLCTNTSFLSSTLSDNETEVTLCGELKVREHITERNLDSNRYTVRNRLLCNRSLYVRLRTVYECTISTRRTNLMNTNLTW